MVKALWAAVRRLVYLVRDSQEDVRALYGSNPNQIRPEERHARAGVIGSFFGPHAH